MSELSSSALPDEAGVYLPLSLLASFAFKEYSDQEHPGRNISAPLSKHPTDLATVIICRYEIGRIIQVQDPGESVFHVELFNNTQHSPPLYHAEVWLAFEWKESTTHGERRRKAAAERTFEANKHKELSEKLADELTAFKLPDALAKLYGEEIARNYKKHNLSALLQQLDLVTAIAEHEKEYPNGNPVNTKSS